MIQISGGQYGGLWADSATGSLDTTGNGLSPAGSGVMNGSVLSIEFASGNGRVYVCTYELRELDPDTGAKAFIFTGQSMKAGI